MSDPQPIRPIYPPQPAEVSPGIEAILRKFADEIRDVAEERIREVRREVDVLTAAIVEIRSELAQPPRPPDDGSRYRVIVEWLAENMPRALELCPYKIKEDR